MLRGRGGSGRGSCVSRKRQAKQAVALGCGMCGLCVSGLWICGWGRCHSTAGADADAVADAIAAAVSSN